MSVIKDCRTDEAYNQKYLDEECSQIIVGYDYSISDNIETFFDNINIYEDDIAYAMGVEEVDSMGLDEDIVSCDKDIDDCSEEELREMGSINALLLTLKCRMLEWAESHRDELIISFIESMDDKEYEILKARADKGEYKNALVRQQDYQERYDAGEIPTCWEYKIDEKGRKVKIGHCPNGNLVVKVL